MAEHRATPIHIHRYRQGTLLGTPDIVAAEEPLELRLGFGPHDARSQKSVAITMRTPGNDLELTLGFLFTEGIIHDMGNITHIDHCTDGRGERSPNVVRAELHPDVAVDWDKLQRNFYTTSSCGICGKASIESLENICPSKVTSTVKAEAETILGLINTMREAQQIFQHTGGLHASALFDASGNMIHLREDIGRHNALDKIIGAAIFQKELELQNTVVLLSGRCCFELVQKSAMAGIPIVVSVGAPSSLAIETAEKFGITLIGFLKKDGFNVYCHGERLRYQD
ncbi:MAG: formate dehydrogenase accessory sulfurtransferase FdhD [Salibacteraceae bacterium]